MDVSPKSLGPSASRYHAVERWSWFTSADGDMVLVKTGGEGTRMREVLLRTFAHENVGAFSRASPPCPSSSCDELD